ncbi:MAG: BlaI/MecI/CopY family transcriptional regulator [Nocardioidaceae bacterium]|jgi:predicted transcriptional regulator|nr:BlaI/MecI/CopY family transcriptional regulator [Nocardioidaceae bacterium]
MATPTAPKLGDLERDVMDRLWGAAEPRSVRDVHAELSAERELAYTTIMTVLDRLTRKQLVSRTREGRAYLYSAVNSRAELTAEMMHDALSVDGLDRTAALVHFADRVTPEEAAALARALERVQHHDEGQPGS